MEEITSNNPFEIFADWHNQAKAEPTVFDHTEMNLATADKNGVPSNRVVLLKKFDERGFVFFTNYNGKKSQDIKENPNASLAFHWHKLGKQIRIAGEVKKTSEAESDEYFASRHPDSRIGAITSKQSSELESREKFIKELDETRAKFENENIPRPDFWGGWRIIPNYIEFWQDGEHRIHHREIFERTDLNKNNWTRKLLYP